MVNGFIYVKKGMKVTYIKEDIMLVIHVIHDSNSSRSIL